jgi:hypothetical protein
MNSYIKNKQRYAIWRYYEKKILEICPGMKHTSGIYMFYRTNEKQERCVYLGQSVDILKRCCEHISVKAKKQHIDKSLAKYGLYSETNPNGWKVKVMYLCEKQFLDNAEKQYIDLYINDGSFKVYNVTGGGQLDKSKDIGERNQTKLKSYKNGKNLGAEKVKEQIRIYFEKYLDVVIKGKPTKIKERKLKEFMEFIEK